MSKQNKAQWVSGWNGGKSGPTCPSCSGATVAGDKWGIIPVGPGRHTVAIVVQQDHEGGEAEMETNAHLIAAAPELYAALRGLLMSRGAPAQLAALKALSKARGES